MTSFQHSGSRDLGCHDEQNRRERGHVDLQPRHPAHTVSAHLTPARGSQVTPIGPDRETEQWVRQLRPGHPRRDPTVAKLRDVLLRVAIHELSRRRGQLGSIRGPEFDDLAQQAVNDALMNILARLDEFRGLSRFTTWAYKFVMFEVSSKVRPTRLAPAAARPSGACVRGAQRLPGTRAGGPARAARATRGPVGGDRRADRAPARSVRRDRAQRRPDRRARD
jgi:hypothetical protein